MAIHGWIGVDLDGTLAHYDGWKGEHHIGEPIPAMVTRIKRWLETGHEVRIFTARMWDDNGKRDVKAVEKTIQAWCLKHIGIALKVTNVKDYQMVSLWDDRAVHVVQNTGNPCCQEHVRQKK